MHVLFIFVVFLCIQGAWFQDCLNIGMDYVCKKVPEDYPPGLTSVIFFVNGLGDISLSMFNSTNLSSVNTLKMANQDVTAIEPQTFKNFENLKTLNLEDNSLSHVSSDWFSHQVPLETLRLAKNKIAALDHDSFNGLSNLLMLNLSQNQIHTITSSSFLTLSKLRHLDLSNNKLTNLSKDVFFPLNGTKISLHGNPWDCSCSVKDFAEYLRGLRNASLLENETLVCCNNPPQLKGVAVWQVPECKTLTTMTSTTANLTTVGHTTEITPSRNPVTVIINKPVSIGHSTLIILIVLYHRKRERKHLQAVKPEKSEVLRTNKTPEKRKIQSESINETQIATKEVLLKTNQMVIGNEKISQIYHIYSSEAYRYESRDPIKRVRSAGAVLCRTNIAKFTEDKEVTTENGMRNYDYYNGWMTTEEQKNIESGNTEEVEKLKDGEKTDRVNVGLTNVSSTTETLESNEETFKETIEDKSVKAGESVDKDLPQCGLENGLSDHIFGTGSSHDEKHVTFQSEEIPDNLPYLTIGADPNNQTTVVCTNTADRTSGPSRPIRRVLTWPPTAVQWKKQWAQNQQVLHMFPNLIFVTGCRHEVRPFYPSLSPASFPTALEFNALEFLPEVTTPVGDVPFDEDQYRASSESCTQKVLHFSPQECFSSANISLKEDCRVLINEETLRSGLESTIDLSSKNSPVDESEVCSELFSIFNPPFSGGSRLKPAVEEEMINANNMEEIQCVKKKTHRDRRVASELQKQSRTAEKTTQRARRDRRQGQIYDSSESRAPPSGGSPKDDSLLRGNEYTFIDLLHEVVENHGRWTRDRWRQTQKNKHKLKQGQSR